ncbi:SICAvar, type I [Plasmodium knowlesi strain H]|uniref:SICAvar, type I n=3 Tax=Plasmodium knowlesi TaxID=5850 RepID=A0A1A7VJ08_PLAKH|nr:SICAvar, type I [Plasmodium knowlesi strain H]OTN66003.1 SICAvar type I [Plasmodium knowlesi]CAA9988017.1 SICAvar, type I [Plasmodium knowlesi strain H]SBO22022.1 SICAvar, type I [Plasmodium knowlesi strain H]SBO29473.1 SICAvar, type I [Plasmodium knowlesi strain H]VVS77491.1 SICAvar, type I [Plasmodium knowlesi strain H]
MAKKFSDVLAPWMKSTGKSGDAAYAEMQVYIQEMFTELGDSLGDAGFPDEVTTACGRLSTNYWSMNKQLSQDKLICKTLLKTIYWMNGIDENGKPEVDGSPPEERYLKQHLRCIVGYSAMVEIMKVKCDVKDVMKAVQSAVEEKIKVGGNELLNNKCGPIKLEDMKFSAQILGKTLGEWVRQMNGLKGMMSLYLTWKMCPSNVTWEHGKIEEGEDGNKDILQLLEEKKAGELHKKVYPQGSPTSAPGGSTSSEDILKQVLQKAQSCSSGAQNGKMEDCLKEKLELGVAEACIKSTLEDTTNSGSGNDKMCNPLKCIENYLKARDAAAPPPGGSTTVTKDFWEEKVKALWKELSDEMVQANGTTAGVGDCDKVKDGSTGTEGRDATHSEKTACNYLYVGFDALYNGTTSAAATRKASSPVGDDILSKKYPSFRQTMGCFLLHSYAKHMKEKAICNIEKGIEKAFELWKNPSEEAPKSCQSSKGKGPCVPCQWKEKDKLDSCLATININGTTGSEGTAKKKVEKIIEDDSDSNIKTMLTNINKRDNLCEHMKCIATHLNSSNGQQNTNVKDFWKGNGEVAKLWEELAKAMTANGKGGKGADCDQVKDGNSSPRNATPSEKTACNFLHAGFKKLYDDSTGTANNGVLSKHSSFRQTMGCFLLHLYAKQMKEKSMCEIEAGIKKAFDLGKGLSINGTCSGGSNGKEPCVPCQWNEDNFNNCKISTDGTTTQTEVKNKLKEIVTENDPKIKTMAEAVNKMDLCDQVKCVAARWRKEKDTSGSPPRDWKKVWEGEDGVKKELGELSKKMKEKTDAASYCTMDEGKGKEACLLIAAGLKNLYNTTTADDLTASFQRTMQCVLLNAIADKLESDELPCKDEKSVQAGINHAFGTENDNIRSGVSTCKDDVKCFKCVREKNLMSCTLNNDDKNVKEKVEPMLKANDTFKKESLEKTICKPCTGEGKKDFCQELNCVVDKWGERKNGSSSGTTTWENMKSDFETELKLLLEDMKGKQTDVAKYCKGNGSAGWEDGAAGEANKKACLLTAAGLHHISNIQLEYNDKANPGKGHDNNPYDNQEFKQFASCLMLKAVAQKMKEESKICDIDQGIRVAFLKAKDIKKEFCKNNKPCIVCKLEDNYDTCTIGNSNVKNKLESLLTDNEHKDNVNNTLSTITKTEGNVGTLCQRLQCLASRVQLTKGKYSADDFWGKEGGEVANLWKELAQAMTDNGGQDKGGQCGTMDDGSAPGGAANGRPATDPEKKACNYLYAGLKALYTTTASPSSSTGNNGILSQHPSLGQTMGCLLLKEYAKKMQSTSTCVIDSGLKRAFDTAGQGSNGVQCKWNEADYDDCQISTTKASGPTTPTPVKDKLDQVKIKIDGTATDNLTEVNKMNNLCDYIRCAAPKWFKNKATAKGGNSNQTWCDFWEREGVRPKLEDMFKGIESDGKNKPNTTICQQFGDDNPHSVERKACNHITAGLEHIKTLSGSGVGVNDNQLLDRAVGCIALNMYADKIIEESNKFCPIDEERINLMFKKWNEKNKLPSSCSTGSGNNNVCFECTRHKDFNNCKLSVDKNLIKTTQSGASGTCTSNATEVKTQMGGLLNNEDKSDPNSIKSNITTTLSFITEMTSSFCTQVQCAIKKRLKIKNGQATSSGTITQPWKNIEEDATKELTKLLEHMMQPSEQKDVDKYCKDNEDKWNKIGHKEGKTNKAACLLFASGLKHIYTRGKGQVNGSVNGPSFAQTMGCLFLKEYAKQFQKMAEVKKQGNSWVHPLCDIDKGIKHAFDKSGEIMNDTSPCKNNGPNSCFVCTQNGSYKDCSIGNESVKDNVGTIFQDDQKQKHMQQTLENTVCPILLTDLLTPFLPLAPVSIGLSAMAYYLWKYFGPLGKGGARFRRSPAEIRGPSVQEQVLDHVQQDSSHEYRLVKERKPRSAPTRTKRSGPVNRRTIIEIHFEVLDECQKGDTQLNQKDFLELLVQEFMGSEFMEEEQVPKEDVLMEPVPMELVPIEEVPMERVPSLGSGLLV